MTVSTRADSIALGELSNLIGITAEIRKYNLQRTGHAVTTGSSLKAVKRRLGMGKRYMYAPKSGKKKSDVRTGKAK